MLPVYSMGNYIDHLIHGLSRAEVRMTYTDNGEDHAVLTSLNASVLGVWLNTHDAATIQQAQENWQNPFHFGVLSLPDLESRQQYVTVPVLGIRRFEKVK